ncbi:MAG: helix-turn-helix domain-containing protein [Bacillota bacterium]|nr:helix-turn-helix domain-containing protein [Bacillota bacterium]
MNCWKCGTETEEKSFTLVSNWKGYKVSIEGVKAEVCPKCGEKTYAADDIKLIHALSEGIKENNKQSDLPEILNLYEVAQILKVTNQTVYNMIRGGKLPAKKVGKKWVFLKSEIENIIKPSCQTIGMSAGSDGISGFSVEEKVMIDDYLKSK